VTKAAVQRGLRAREVELEAKQQTIEIEPSAARRDQMPNYVAATRDLRIDFCRGLILYMILVDHVIGDPISRFTLQNFGFSDAAEAFVFLSGLSCGIVYFRILRRGGWPCLTAAISKRTSQIYVYYVLASTAVILILKTTEGAIKNAGVSHSFLVLREAPISAIWSTVLLISSPDLPRILVTYLVLTAVVSPLFLWGAGASAVLTLTASGFVWTIPQIYPNLLSHLTDYYYFNPFAWQFLFSLGMFVGLRYNSDAPRPRTTQMSIWLVAAAWAYIIFALLYRYRSPLHLGWLPTMINDKGNLSAARLLHFLSIALLFATYIRPNNPILSWWPTTVVIRTGQCSLEVFSMGAILSVLLSLVALLHHPTRLEKVALDGVAVLLMSLTALVLTRHRQVSGLPKTGLRELRCDRASSSFAFPLQSEWRLYRPRRRRRGASRSPHELP
jgi:hypothetical protein